MLPDEDLHRHAVENLDQADALLLGVVTYEMMEEAWRPAPASPFTSRRASRRRRRLHSRADARQGTRPRGRRKKTRRREKNGEERLLTGGVKLPQALAELGLIDEYEFMVQPRLVGHGPTLFAGLSKHIDLRLVSRMEFGSGAVAMRYELKR
jgi:dihydrofolate reductase